MVLNALHKKGILKLSGASLLTGKGSVSHDKHTAQRAHWSLDEQSVNRQKAAGCPFQQAASHLIRLQRVTT